MIKMIYLKYGKNINYSLWKSLAKSYSY